MTAGNKIVDVNRRRVKLYINDALFEDDKTPLYFRSNGQRALKDLFNAEKGNLSSSNWEEKKSKAIKKILLKILVTSKTRMSYSDKSCKYSETNSGRRRSSIDLYRHFMSLMGTDDFLSENNIVSIFEVLSALYEIITRGNIVRDGHKPFYIKPNYCFQVERLVFYAWTIPFATFSSIESLRQMSTEFGFTAASLDLRDK